jgi:hypothetical protein
MRAREQRAGWTPSGHLLVSLFGMAVAALLAGAGCGRIAKNPPEVGGESHFLHWCSGSCDEEGLECISGLCTKPCVVAEPNSCSEFSGASCTDRSIEPGAVAICDVGCNSDAGCAALGGDPSCQGGFCRLSQSEGLTESAPLAKCSNCLEQRFLKWGTVGGRRDELGTYHWSELSTCADYLHTYTWASGNVDGPLPGCNRSVDGCPVGTLSQLSALAKAPELQAGLPEKRLFGVDERIGGGDVFQISVSNPDGSNGYVLVGSPCAGAPGCVEIPAAVGELMTALQALDDAELAEEPCASVFPDGTAGSYTATP